MKTIRILVIILLLINGIGALYGGLSFILYPDGSGMGISIDWLQNSPFRTFLIPGILLFIFNGLTSLCIIAAFIAKRKYVYLLVTLQGLILVIWIAAEVVFMQTVNFMHIIMGTVGIILIAAGLVSLNRLKKSEVL